MADLAESGELEVMVVDTESAFVAEPGLECGKAGLDDAGTREVDHLSAARAYQVVVMLWRAGSVAGTVVASMELTYKPQLRQQPERAVDSNQSDAGMVPADLLKNCRRGEVVRARGKGVYHRTSLWS